MLAIDVRGRGDSAWGPAGDYTAQNYMADLAGFLEALGIARVTLIGTSMGGMISIVFAGGYPDRVERVVLNDIGPDIDPAGLTRIQSYVGTSPSEFSSMNDVLAYYREIYPPIRRLSEQEQLEWAKWSVKAAPGGKLGWKMDPEIRRPARGSAARPIDMWTPFARIEAPILVLRGAESDILARRTIDRMKSTGHDLQWVEIPGVGHAPSLTEPESLAALKEFLGL